MNTQQLYESAPLWIQNIAVNLKGRSICKRRYNQQFFEDLRAFENHKFNQAEELQRFLLSLTNVDAYKDVLTTEVVNELKQSPQNVYDIIRKFPIIGKKDVREYIGKYTNTDFKGESFEMRTSGTTGSGLAFPYPVDFENKQWALWWRFRQSLGIKFGTWCAWFGGKRMIKPNCNRPPYWRVNTPGRQVMYSSYHLTRDTVQLFYDDIKRRGLAWIHGYPSHIAKLSALLIELQLKPLDGIKWVTTGAEGLVGNQLKLIQQAFPNAVVRSHYGQNEGVAIMNQDKNGEWYVEDDFSFVEFIPVSPQQPNLCRIVGTAFFNKQFALVRYDTGDLATVERSEDGSVKRILSIDGRTGNTVKQPSGHEITEAALSIVLHDFDNIAEAQFHQIALDEIVLWVVRNTKYSTEDELELMKSLAKAFDSDMKISIKYVNAVERTKAGKLRLVITDF